MYKSIYNTYSLSSDCKLLFLPDNPQRKKEGGLRKKGYFKSDRSDLPLVSIITVVFNGEKHLESTIKSIINQSYHNIEYIIIDGGSSDRTLDIIQSYENNVDYWVSEPDTGIYDAMNKGISVASGKLIGIINSDDYYTDGAVENVVNAYIDNKDCEKLLISGGICKLNDSKQVEWQIFRNQRYVDSKIYWTMPVSHPATFVSRKLYDTVGCFNSKFKISGDYDLVFRAYHSPEAKFVFIDRPLACMREGGVSNQFMHILTRAFEHFEIKKYKMSLILNVLITFLWFLVEAFKYLFLTTLLTNSLGTRLFLRYNQLRHSKH